MNRNGEGIRQLIAWRWHTGEATGSHVRSRVLPYGWFLRGPVGDGSSDVFVYKRRQDNLGDTREFQLARMDTQTGLVSNLSEGIPDGSWDWLLDKDREPRVIGALKNGRYSLHWRAPGTKEWKRLQEFDAYGDDDLLEPVYVEDGSRLIVSARAGRNASALYAYDLSTRKLSPEPLVAVEGFDLDPVFQFEPGTHRLLGFHFRTERPRSYWFDDKLHALQAGIDKALPGRFNRIFCGRCAETRFFVIRSSSDQEPGEYFLLDREKGTLALLGKSRPWIDESQQGKRSFHRVRMRDGLEIPVYVTHPAGTSENQKLPTVVLVHGGPNVRGTDLRWDDDAQFLASRGYRVIEPEFRGTTGYGQRLFRAGWREWGRAMQDDLEDAVLWAAGRGMSDPERVCIMGASYGGYAALMGPIRHPGRYRCAISFAGVADIELMYSISWSDMSEEAKRYSMPTLIGDPEKDADRLRSASPLKRAAEIKVPILLAHGTLDRRVPIAHATRFTSAARNAGVQIEAVTYNDEGHGWFSEGNHTDFYSRVEKFLEKHLSAPK